MFQGVKKLRVGRYIDERKKNRNHSGRRKSDRTLRKKNKKLTKRNKRIIRFPHASVLSKLRFKWRRAKKTFLPQAWVISGDKNRQKMLKYDYAMIQLKRPLRGDYMKLGIAPNPDSLPSNRRMHFTTFDSKNRNQLVYRSCVVESQSSDFLFHRCDATDDSSGAGIYMKLYDPISGEWDRKVIGVFSGFQSAETGGDGPIRKYNVGIRVTPLKFAQICYWKTGNYTQCRNG